MAVNATAIWRVRPSGSNTNGGGYDPGISGAATDYSQQNAAQATGTHGSGSASTTFTDATAANFTSAMIGNCINISGQGFYFVTAFISATQVTVDRALGTFSGASWSLGGGWADLWTNTNTTTNVLVPGNIVYILGSGVPNPSAYTVDYTYTGTNMAWVSGSNSSGGSITFAADPATPGYKAAPDTTGGMPVIAINTNALTSATSYIRLVNLWLLGNSNSCQMFTGSTTGLLWYACIFDAVSFSNAAMFIGPAFGAGQAAVACEFWASAGGGGSGSAVVSTTSGSAALIGCNFHDIGSGGAAVFINSGAPHIIGSIFAKNGGDAITVNSDGWTIMNCTIDGNTGSGINFPSGMGAVRCMNNVITNHTGVSKSGITNTSGVSAAVAAALSQVIDFNSLYNNTANYTATLAGAHDTALSTSPYVASSVENYTLV